MNNISLLALPRSGFPSETILLTIFELGVVSLDEPAVVREMSKRPGAAWVLVNGLMAGVTLQPQKIVDEIRRRRRHEEGWVSRFTSVYRRETFVYITSDPGDLLRPVLVLDNLGLLPKTLATLPKGGPYTKLMLFDALVENGVIEYLSANEQEHFRVAVKPRDVWTTAPGTYSHLEVNPYAIFGISAALIPHLHMNQSPRNVLQCALGKQAMGEWPKNLESVMTGRHEALHYAEVPLDQTLCEGAMDTCDQATGTNLLIAIKAEGFDMEDALILNQDLMDLGYMRASVFRTYTDTTHVSGTDKAEFGRPDPNKCTAMRKADYTKIDPEYGCIRPGERASAGDVVISKVVESREATSQGRRSRFRDHSLLVNKDERGSVVRSAELLDEDTFKVMKVVTEMVMIPEIGDKFSS